MSKKKIRDVDALDLLNDGPANASMQSIDAQLFGAIKNSDANRQSASPVSIHNIHPDLAQPRRAIPEKVRSQINWNGDNSRMEDLFHTWVELVNEERKSRQIASFDLVSYLEQPESGQLLNADLERPEDIGPLEHILVNLIALATSIQSEGLTNPITVVQTGTNTYQIETGERRWLAYHLLYLHTQDNKFAKIAARTVDKLNIWRQAAENNARSNLNAISKARQFAVLLMELLSDMTDAQYKPFTDFSQERLYYAQVADGEVHRIPRGTSERLLNATGLKSPKQLREYRALLRLPREVWNIADDLNWTERAIRDLAAHAIDDDELVQLAIRRAREEGYSVPMGTLPERKINTIKSANLKPKQTIAPGEKGFYTYFMKVVRRGQSGKNEDDREQAFEMIDEFRRWLDEQEFLLSKDD